ncbi:MAG: sulfite exporter TauE/SafE family protein [Pseudomonadota bacterium]
MPELWSQALAQPGLIWLLGAALAAGLVRGFSGFGTAMVYLPVAGTFLGPFAALTTLLVMDLFGPLPNVPRALRDRHPGDMSRLVLGLVIALPIGVLVLAQVPAEAFRYAVSLIALALLVLLISGYRYRGALTPRLITGTGMLGGFLGGSTGLPGPPVIMLYMASTHPAHVVRATLMLYLVAVDVLMLGIFWLYDRLEPGNLVLGFCVMVPYLLGNILGGWLFRPGQEKIYRGIAYLVIALSAIIGLPFWGG